MFSFLRNLTSGFVSKSETNEDKKDSSVESLPSKQYLLSDDLFISNAFNGQKEDTNQDSFSVSTDDQVFNGVNHEEIEDEEEVDEWNDDWMAFEERSNHKNDSHLDVCQKSINGVVTHIISDNEIIIDDTNRCKFNRCTFGAIETGDLVHVESNSDNQMIVKPLRYKILTGKITDDEVSKNRFIFGRHAYLRKTPELQNLRVGDAIKVLVIESRNNSLNWRAIKYTEDKNQKTDQKDETEEFTNKLLEDKNQVYVCDKINFGQIKIDSKKTLLVWIKNKSSEPQTFLSCDNEEGENQISFKSFQSCYGKSCERPFIIPPHEECYVELECDAKYCGDHNELLIFKFKGFKIGRFTYVTVYDFNSLNDKLIRGNRFDMSSFRRRLFGDDTWILPGEKVWNPTKHIHDKLEQYHVPEKVWRALENNWEIETVLENLKPSLNKDNYHKKFHELIYLEECENYSNLRQYDMENANLRREGRYLALNVPGLADGRPSLIVSDKVICYDGHNPNKEKKIAYEGIIHEIRKDDILMRFNEKFHEEFRGGTFKVVFQMSRMLYRRCHHAIDLTHNFVDQVLFPNKVLIKKPFKRIPLESIKWFNPMLNLRQKLAAVGALRGECRPTPYIIFGPPGTGKTVTIVESILQVFTKIPQSRIIACTSANSSADLIANKLLESGQITERDIIRISAFHRINAIPDSLKSITKVAEEDEKKWLYHRIVVTTCSQSGIIFRYKISPSHFTHVFIDEAAQCLEPESLIPISMSVIGHGCVVLAGDHQQLGPVVMSTIARNYRLNHSLMERLMTCCKPYERSEQFSKYGYYNPKFVTKLVTNYRSDSKIMSIPSKLFYDNELNCVNLTDSQLIKSMNFKNPVVFTGVRGEDRQDPDCPSWYNPQEIIQSCSYLEKLYQIGVKPHQIGIITPYRKQVIKMRSHIRDMDLEECKVATIEEFQGDERRVIIISMVRASQHYLNHDLKFSLGFVHNQKRFNVAVSRAMSLLICIGDPNLLSRDKYWQQFINYCLENESYNGCKFRDYNSGVVLKRSQFNG